MSLSVAATPANLTRYLNETPASVEKSLTREEKLCSIAMKISAFAAIAFFAFPLLIAAGVISTSWIGVPTALGCVVAAIICTRGHTTFEKRMHEVQLQKDLYAGVFANESEGIKPGETKGIEEFFKDNKGSIAQIPPATMTALAKINPAKPLDALKPLIVRYQEAGLLAHGLIAVLKSTLIATGLLTHAKNKSHYWDKWNKQVQKEEAMFRLVPHYANQKKECAELLGLKA
jgi:hypothetical protein